MSLAGSTHGLMSMSAAYCDTCRVGEVCQHWTLLFSPKRPVPNEEPANCEEPSSAVAHVLSLFKTAMQHSPLTSQPPQQNLCSKLYCCPWIQVHCEKNAPKGSRPQTKEWSFPSPDPVHHHRLPSPGQQQRPEPAPPRRSSVPEHTTWVARSWEINTPAPLHVFSSALVRTHPPTWMPRWFRPLGHRAPSPRLRPHSSPRLL
uniref:Uncharacterized protein n=1 Tax=Knipowitschia caucasica TaxID=637954 RepID=A0AAV2KIM7_KNICA